MNDSNVRDNVDVLDAIWRGKWLVIIATALFAVGSVLVAINMTNVYRVETVLAPVASDNPGDGGIAGLAGQFGGLASLAGVQLGGVKTDKTSLALEYLRSRTFLMAFIERHQVAVPLLAGYSWDKESDKLSIDPAIYDEASQTWVRAVDPPRTPEPTGWELYELFLELITLEQDSATGLVRLSVEYYSPSLAQDWARWLIEDLNDFMRKKDLAEAQRSIQYLRGQVETTQLVGMQDALYELIEEQLKISMLAEVREEYAFSYVDPPLAPETKYKPRRAIIAIVGTFAGGVLGVLLALVVGIRRSPSI